MDYLTNYYKNLSEQLQEKVNHLEQLLEYRKKSTMYIDVDDVDPYTGESVPRIIGTEVTKHGNPVGKGARQNARFSTYPGMGAIRNVGDDQEALAWEIVSNSGRPTVEDNPIYASMKGKGPALEVGSGEVFQDPSDLRRKGGSEPGMGKKARKKALAISLAQIRARNAGRDLHPNAHDGPDPDFTASSAEVVASQQRRQFGE